ncbi:MAG: DUF937 domain-containing protein [Pseudomonadales bacterium]
MAFNLVDLIKDQLGDQILGQVGNILGADATQTGTAVGGALPAILKSLLTSAGTSSGAESIFNTVNEQDDGILDNLGSLLGGDTSSMIEVGTKALGSLLGDNALGKLAGAVASFSGIGKSSGGSLLGLLAPIIFSVVKRKVVGEGLDIGGLASMLTGQKDNIDAAMPQGLADLINPPAAAEPAPAMAAVSAPEEEGSSIWRKLLPLLAVVVVGWLALKMFGGGDEAADAGSVQLPDASSVAGMDVGKQIGDVLGSATNTLSGITDVESAQAALPDINAMTSKLDGMTGMLDQLPEGARESVSGAARNGLGQLQPVIDKVMEIPGVGPVLRPAVEGLMEKLAIISG